MQERAKYFQYFRDRVKERLVQKGWRQVDLANALGKEQQQVSNLLTGLRNPGVQLLAQIADAINVQPGWLIPPVEKTNGTHRKANGKTHDCGGVMGDG